MTLESYGLRRRIGINRELAESGDLRKKEEREEGKQR